MPDATNPGRISVDPANLNRIRPYVMSRIKVTMYRFEYASAIITITVIGTFCYGGIRVYVEVR